MIFYYIEFELLHNVKPNPRNYVKDVKLIGRKIVLSPAEPSFFRLKLILFASDRKSQSQDMRAGDSGSRYKMSANLRKYILYHDSCLKEICKIPPLADKMSIGVTDRLLLAMHES